MLHPITLDTADSPALEVKAEDYGNEIRTLVTLRRGMAQLFRVVKAREITCERVLAPFSNDGKSPIVLSWGVDFDNTTHQLEMIALYFQWFGVTLSNYVRLVGFIRGLHRGEIKRADLRDKTTFKAIKSVVDDYVNSVSEISNVLVWRNKVGAHPAITYPHKDDNIATLDMSVMHPVSLSNARYHVGEFELVRQEGVEHVSQFPQWSLTQIFESLIPRFWPELKVVSTEQILIDVMFQPAVSPAN